MSYITIAEEKKEFISKHLHIIGVEDKKQMSRFSLRSTRYPTLFFLALFVISLCLLLFQADSISYYIKRALFPGIKIEYIGLTVLIFLLYWILSSYHLLTKYSKARLMIEKDMKTLRILLDYMRIGKKHFIEVLKATIPGAEHSDYETFADRIFRLNI